MSINKTTEKLMAVIHHYGNLFFGRSPVGKELIYRANRPHLVDLRAKFWGLGNWAVFPVSNYGCKGFTMAD
jgi:hypothetical protein